MSRRRRLPGAVWLAYFAFRNAVRAAYYLGAVPPAWAEAGVHGPWLYLGVVALFWALAFGGGVGLWWRWGRRSASWILVGMILYQIHGWAHRLFLMRSPFIAQSHAFALGVSLLVVAATAGLLRLDRGDRQPI